MEAVTPIKPALPESDNRTGDRMLFDLIEDPMGSREMLGETLDLATTLRQF